MPAVATPRDVDVLPPNGNISQLTISPQFATGRQADSVRDQFVRDLAEARAARNDGARSEFQEIKATLDGYQHLAALSHSHGLVVGKYQVTKGRDGSDRIQAGSRNLNVSDFLTKETNLPWSEAALSMREQYRAQTGLDPAHAPAARRSRICGTNFSAFGSSTAMHCVPNGWSRVLVSKPSAVRLIRSFTRNAVPLSTTTAFRRPRAVLRCQWLAWSGSKLRPSCETRSLASAMH
jgi:hypothetical protein